MALTGIDRNVLQRCLQHETGSWNDFVDRYLGLIYHVIHYTAHLRSLPLEPEMVEEIAEQVLIQLVAGDYALLRQFRGNSSLASYLTVVCRRICVRELIKRQGSIRRPLPAEFRPTEETREAPPDVPDDSPKERIGLESLERVRKLLRKMHTRERSIAQMFYLEGRTHEEISTELHVPVAEVAKVLKAVRKYLRTPPQGKPGQ